MSTYRSAVTSWAIRSIGNNGARSSGPIGCSVPGCSGGGGGLGRSGTTLYHCVGSCDSSSMILCCNSATASPSGLAPPVRRSLGPPCTERGGQHFPDGGDLGQAHLPSPTGERPACPSSKSWPRR